MPTSKRRAEAPFRDPRTLRIPVIHATIQSPRPLTESEAFDVFQALVDIGAPAAAIERAQRLIQPHIDRYVAEAIEHLGKRA